MLSEVGEKRNGVKINAMVGMCILACPGACALQVEACVGMRKENIKNSLLKHCIVEWS